MVRGIYYLNHVFYFCFSEIENVLEKISLKDKSGNPLIFYNNDTSKEKQNMISDTFYILNKNR